MEGVFADANEVTREEMAAKITAAIDQGSTTITKALRLHYELCEAYWVLSAWGDCDEVLEMIDAAILSKDIVRMEAALEKSGKIVTGETDQ